MLSGAERWGRGLAEASQTNLASAAPAVPEMQRKRLSPQAADLQVWIIDALLGSVGQVKLFSAYLKDSWPCAGNTSCEQEGRRRGGGDREEAGPKVDDVYGGTQQGGGYERGISGRAGGRESSASISAWRTTSNHGRRSHHGRCELAFKLLSCSEWGLQYL